MTPRPDPRSPWGSKLWIPADRFDPMMDAVRSRAGQTALVPRQGIDVDVILKDLYCVDPDFCVLPKGCLGRTTFLADGSFYVQVSADLANEAVSSPVARRRLRSTLAHECAHIALHAALHPIRSARSLFDDMACDTVAVMCRGEGIEAGGSAPDWWEYQANRGMASLLLPRDLLRAALSSSVQVRGLTDLREALATEQAEAVLRDLMELFDVGYSMTLYRLQDLGYLPKYVGQGGLTHKEG